jgi:Fe-S cluster biogenesis protein NfuA
MAVEDSTARVTIVAEHTPNPDCVRLAVNRPLLGAPADFPDAAAARAGSPLAARLFALGGIRRVLLGADFVAVTKDPETDWRALGPALQSALRLHLERGEPLLAPGYAPPPARDEGAALAEIGRILDREIRPAVVRDGGDVAALAFRDGVLELELRGSCAGCPNAARTLAQLIEVRLRELVPELERVEARDR